VTATAHDPTKLIEAARTWYDAGFCVVPSHEDGGKRPFGAWKQYQEQRPEWAKLYAWLSSGKYTGIGVITGSVSGNAEMLEIEGPHDEMLKRLKMVADQSKRHADISLDQLWERVVHGFMESSAGGGMHIFIRITDGPATHNTKLAHNGEKIVAETRGEGGFVIVWPTQARKGHEPGSAYLLEQGGPATVANVTSDERDALHELFRMALHNWDVDLDATPAKPEPVAPTVPVVVSEGISPFDDFAQRMTWEDILEPAGWTLSHTDHDGRQHWTRPGKDKRDGASGNVRDGCLYIHSTSVTNLPVNQGLSKAHTYAWLNHSGDLSTAARALRDAGYGDTTYVLPSWSPEATIEPTFYDQHPTLAAIRQAAHSRIVSADAVLGCILARVAQHIPWEYALPPIVAGKSSPNLYVALIGPSGSGKGGARRTADELLAMAPSNDRPDNEGPLGSGEGIVSLFYGNPLTNPDDPDSPRSKTLEFMYRNVMVLDEEGSGLAELLKRQGQLTEPVLLKMWSGENLGMSYSARSSAVQLKVPGDQYRAAALLGIQPAAAAFLLEDERSDKGLPQRFLWASTIDPALPDERIPFPGPINWRPPTFGRAVDSTLVDVAPEIHQELVDQQRQRVRGTAVAHLDSHSGLVTLKAATALAALLRPGEPLVVDLDTWNLAKQLKESSDKVRVAVHRQAQAERDKVTLRRQEVAVRQRVAVQQVDSQVKNCARTIQKHIQRKHGEEGQYCTKSCARKSIASGYRDVFDAAIEAAIELEWVADISDDDAEIRHYTLGESRPA
jgi:hypothetical protein